MATKLYIDNDNTIRLLGLKLEATLAFINDATVTVTVLDAIGGTPVSGPTWPVNMSYIGLAADSMGGEAGGPTVIKSIAGFDLEVTVGTSNALLLGAGRFLQVLHTDDIWRVLRAASGGVGTDVVLHVEPIIAVDSRGRALKTIKGNAGEEVYIVDGSYQGTLQETMVLTAGTTYYGEITVDAPTEGVQGKFVVELEATNRTS